MKDGLCRYNTLGPKCFWWFTRTAPWWTNQPEWEIEKNVPTYLIADSKWHGCFIIRMKKKKGCLHSFYRTTDMSSWPDRGFGGATLGISWNKTSMWNSISYDLAHQFYPFSALLKSRDCLRNSKSAKYNVHFRELISNNAKRILGVGVHQIFFDVPIEFLAKFLSK